MASRRLPVRVRTLSVAGLVAVVTLLGWSGPTAGASTGVESHARPSVAAASDWTTFDHDSLRSGVDGSGNSFSPATAAWTSPSFDGQLYGQPLVYGGRVYAATENDTVYALAADSGQVLWSSHLGTPLNPSTVAGLCGNIHPTVGITGTPVIDPTRSEIFVVATEAATVGGLPNAAHHLIGLSTFTGRCMLDEVIDPPGTNPAFQLQRVSLGLTQGRVVVGFGGNPGTAIPTTAWWSRPPRTARPRRSSPWPTSPVTARVRCGWVERHPPSTPRATSGWPPGNSAHHASGDAYDQSDSVLKLSPTHAAARRFGPDQLVRRQRQRPRPRVGGARPPAQRPGLRGGQVADRLRAQPVLPRRRSGGQVASTAGFCFSDGGSADLGGTLFVPVQQRRPRRSPSPRRAPSASWTAG